MFSLLRLLFDVQLVLVNPILIHTYKSCQKTVTITFKEFQIFFDKFVPSQEIRTQQAKIFDKPRFPSKYFLLALIVSQASFHL